MEYFSQLTKNQFKNTTSQTSFVFALNNITTNF